MAADRTAVTATRETLRSALSYERRPQVRARWMSTLRRLIALPTVSGSPALERAATLLAHELTAIGMQKCQIIRAGPGAPPSVWAERRDVSGAPCLLLYGHFDVQPPGSQPWRRSPFSAEVIDGRVHGRGASDNKGPLVCLLAGLDSHLATAGRLPVNVRIWLEGEEERGSPNLRSFVDRYGDLLRADVVAFSDSPRVGGVDRPTLITGLRGMLDFALTVAGPAHELHSGSFGGEVHDPAIVLSQLVSSLWGVDGRIRVAGFYQDVRNPTDRERIQQSAFGTRRRALAATAGVSIRDLRGECQWSPGERSTLRPSMTVVGLSAGQIGPKSVAAIPISATARINIRLVPDQRPDEVAIQVREHLRRAAPPRTRFRLEMFACADPVTVQPTHPVVEALHKSLSATWGQQPIFKRSGGTIAVVAELHRRYKMPAAMWGLSGLDDRFHAADESIAVRDLRRGVEVVTRLLHQAAQ